jgi:putative flavoredoxin
MFLAEIVGIRADEAYIDPETGAFDMKRAGLLVYAHGEYFGLGDYIGHFGWSVRKRKTKRR